MGGKKSKPEKDPREEIEDAILDMRMTSKQFERAAQRAGKDQKKEIQKAKDALKKSNDEGAKLFLQNAATKYKEQQNLMRMAHRMDAISAHLKSNMTNTDVSIVKTPTSPTILINVISFCQISSIVDEDPCYCHPSAH
jgi:charged multivesicular body protein 1